ncbi:uncharacterized protein K452DRAFT_109169 [Aplosporella prunicola CBS 121167]|uniref:Uncharacterized protein n=1 Tax=Aplosporella prunicola CBS 121167 TaxID=1176127 RepID=A0A6A6BQE9_9PEZI|nr:uncharacterized protein K452DRAFT_109169 [Aplosporella prunicola CBS 121167]KAF2146339.1 hypothetical protein K452DRAFT_109169 [Aplosporella prunicola CBS 121167]
MAAEWRWSFARCGGMLNCLFSSFFAFLLCLLALRDLRRPTRTTAGRVKLFFSLCFALLLMEKRSKL